MAEDRIYLALYKNQQRAFVNTGMSVFILQKKRAISGLVERLLAYEAKPFSLKLYL